MPCALASGTGVRFGEQSEYGNPKMAADEPALMPWPPTGPRWAVELLLRVLVFYPVPLLPGFVEMACCDG